MTAPVRAIGNRRNNAQLMLDCRALGYVSDDMDILDPTVGRHSGFWKAWWPEGLVGTDLDPGASDPSYGPVDFTRLGRVFDYRFHAVVFDPPYKLNGAPVLGEFDRRYGVEVKQSIESRHRLIREGINSIAEHALRPHGYLLIKCQDQVASGRVHWQTRIFADHAESLGFRLKDMLFVQSYRPQPAGRSQQHVRRDYSTLLVLRR